MRVWCERLLEAGSGTDAGLLEFVGKRLLGRFV